MTAEKHDGPQNFPEIVMGSVPIEPCRLDGMLLLRCLRAYAQLASFSSPIAPLPCRARPGTVVSWDLRDC
jgi:hypothetical protein